MTPPVVVQPAPEARVGRWIAGSGAPQVQPGVREICGRASRVIYTPAIGLVIVRGPHAQGERLEGASGSGVGVSDLVHTPHQTTADAAGER